MTHVKKHFQAWSEGKLDSEAREGVERHIEACVECRGYFSRMSAFLEKPHAGDLPRLEPDPFLPTRLRAGGSNRRRAVTGWPRWLQASFAGVALVAAVAAGIYLGAGAAREPVNGETQLLTGYYEALSQSGIGDNWDQIMGADDNNGHGEL
jgi:predicted anti-sigma-YlaC factor YlaD